MWSTNPLNVWIKLIGPNYEEIIKEYLKIT